jgi:hypothetical protein
MLKIIALKPRRRNLQAFHNHNEPHNLFHFHKFLGRHPMYIQKKTRRSESKWGR